MRGMTKALTTLVALIAVATAAAAPIKTYTSKPFAGVKANTGSVTATVDNGKITMRLSDDFKVPDTPAPHWQIVDSKGNTFLLNRLMIKGDKYNQEIMLPSYIKDVAKVQIWCSFAEALLGETSFDGIVK